MWISKRRYRELVNQRDAAYMLTNEVINLTQRAAGKPYIATLGLENIVRRYFKRLYL